MTGINEYEVPRWIGSQPDDDISLHVFADASEKGYGCCVYIVNASSTVHVIHHGATEAEDRTCRRMDRQFDDVALDSSAIIQVEDVRRK